METLTARPVGSDPTDQLAVQAPSAEQATRLRWNDRVDSVVNLSVYAIEIEPDELDTSGYDSSSPETHEGSLDGFGLEIPIQFRVRQADPSSRRVKLAYVDLSIAQREQIESLLARMDNPNRDDLHALTYDDLASGQSKSVGSSGAKPSTPDSAKPASAMKKLIAMLMMLGTLVVVTGWVVYLVQARSSVAVNNSVVVGNYLPINTPTQALLVELLVQTGDPITTGQPVARLRDQVAEMQLELVESKLIRARRQAQAYEAEAAALGQVFGFNQQKVDRDIQVAQAELLGIDAELSAARATLARLQPLIARGNIAMAEIDEAKAQVAVAEAGLVRQRAVMEQLRLAEQAADQGLVVTNTGLTNPMSELNTHIALANAEITELEHSRTVLQANADLIELTAPADGTVYAVYRSVGETLKVAEQMLAISTDNGGWATGGVAPDAAPDLRPGQPVDIEIPSLAIETTGIVEAIGHRAVYGQGGYNADFRGGPLDVPIRVAVDLQGQPIPSGLRLHMTVRVKDHLKEVKTWINETIAWLHSDQDPQGDPPVVASTQPQDDVGNVLVTMQ
ncbi:MAG: HlyD family efflux transporter periplasmic adaptor subunit [Planctomycetota bacterium]